MDFLKASGEALLESFVNPYIIRHPKGHTVPRLDEKSMETMLEFLEKIEADLPRDETNTQLNPPPSFPSPIRRPSPIACVSRLAFATSSSLRLFSAKHSSVQKLHLHPLSSHLLQMAIGEATQFGIIVVLACNREQFRTRDEGAGKNHEEMSESVAKIMETPRDSLKLNVSPFDVCWSLFKGIAFEGRDPSMHDTFVEIGLKIVEKCRGLPLAVKVLGYALRNKDDEYMWMDVLESEMWEFDEGKDEILPARQISYDYMNITGLRRCFPYLSLFPKDIVLRPGRIVLLWMSQGFLQPASRIGLLHPRDDDCPIYAETDETYTMHDVFQSLAQFVVRDECLGIEDNVGQGPLCRASICGSLADLLRNSGTDVKSLPDSICNLYNLETLNLNKTYVSELPRQIVNLTSLRHLLLYVSCVYLPQGIGELTNLQTLSNFRIVTLLSRPIAEEDHDDCEDEEYYGNSKEGKGDEHAIKEKRLLEYLRPHANLKMLQIYDYPGVSFAKWVGTSSFSKPVQLWLCRCRKCNFLPPLGQLHSLKILCIQEMDGMHIVGREFCSSPMVKAFPSLESLAFVRMPNWEVWDEVEVGDFPHLQHIKLYECPKLTKFPHHLMSSVKELSIKGCDGVSGLLKFH
ncbi:putative disease resistance protein At3g14460 [Zingiber officinale]|uniref:putative disease resistance protein At3g14460 n=1 Tax=Zingiber officinale TaxID=94328 RepID=UPI001C4B35AC|nr:putative disease resistance protein At3g14460 [Zingiber officinale]